MDSCCIGWLSSLSPLSPLCIGSKMKAITISAPPLTTKAMSGYGTQFNPFKQGPKLGSVGPSISPPGLGQFKPPLSPSYGPPPTTSGSEEEMGEEEQLALLGKVREREGPWQGRAEALIRLQKYAGFTSEQLYEYVSVPPNIQTTIVVALQVYNSLLSSETASEVLESFDESRIDVLYALRTLSTKQRKAAAEYAYKESLGVPQIQELVRAMKDHERKPREREGFTTEPADCLAFVLFRAALEAKEGEEKRILLQRGLQIASSDSAKQKLLTVDC